MNENKHTPAPFVAEQSELGHFEVLAPSASKTKRRVARLGGPDREANAMLIAAAPDMLAIHRDSVEALEIVLEEREEIVGEDEVLRDLISRIKEVVAKATGAAK